MRVYHFHGQKTGGTSVNHAVFSLAYDPAAFPDGIGDDYPGRAVYRACVRTPRKSWSGNGFTVAHFDPATIREGAWNYAHSHLPFDQVVLPEGTFRFTILRDPIERLVSRFRMVCDLHAAGNLAHYRWQDMAPYCETLDIVGFAMVLPPTERLHQLHLFSASGDVAEAAERIAGIDAVLRYEHLAGDFAALCRYIGWPPLALPHAKRGVARLAFDRATMERLGEIVAPERQLLAAMVAAGSAPMASSAAPQLSHNL